MIERDDGPANSRRWWVRSMAVAAVAACVLWASCRDAEHPRDDAALRSSGHEKPLPPKGRAAAERGGPVVAPETPQSSSDASEEGTRDCEISGLVLGPAGSSVGPGVRVSCARPADGALIAETTADPRTGLFRLTFRRDAVPANDPFVQVSAFAADGRRTRAADVAAVGPLAGSAVVLRLRPTGAVRAIAVDEAGRPVPGAEWAIEVHAAGVESPWEASLDRGVPILARSGTGGELELGLPESQIVVFAREPGGTYGPMTRASVAAGSTTDLGPIATGGRGVTFELHVRDETGAPIVDAEIVTLTPDAMGRAGWEGGLPRDLLRDGATDAAGRADVRVRTAETPAFIAVGAWGRECVQLVLDRRTPGQFPIEVVLSNAPRVRIQGIPKGAGDPAEWWTSLQPLDVPDRQFIPLRWVPADARARLAAEWAAKVAAHRELVRRLREQGRPESEYPPPPERIELPSDRLATRIAKASRMNGADFIELQAPWPGDFHLQVVGPDGVKRERIVRVTDGPAAVIECPVGPLRAVIVRWEHLGDRGPEVADLRLRAHPRTADLAPRDPEALESRLTEAWRVTGGVRVISSSEAARGRLTFLVPPDCGSIAFERLRADWGVDTEVVPLTDSGDAEVRVPESMFPGTPTTHEIRVAITLGGEPAALRDLLIEATPEPAAATLDAPRRRVCATTDPQGTAVLRLLPGRWSVRAPNGFGREVTRQIDVGDGPSPAEFTLPLDPPGSAPPDSGRR